MSPNDLAHSAGNFAYRCDQYQISGIGGQGWMDRERVWKTAAKSSLGVAKGLPKIVPRGDYGG